MKDKNMKIKFIIMVLLTGVLGGQSRSLPSDTTVVTTHKIMIKGDRIEYKVTTGTQPVWNEDGNPIAYVHYTYYERSDIKDRASRPIMVSFNGGPGSGSVWMHLAYTGPKILKVDDEGFPVQPYGVKDNPYSILDVADIVYVNPVNTGYSRIVDKETKKEVFFGVNADIKYLSEWINTFIQRINRWESPKYLIGESYGTTRVSGLSLALQSRQWMYLNGVILVSPTELGVDRGLLLFAGTDSRIWGRPIIVENTLMPVCSNKSGNIMLENKSTLLLKKCTANYSYTNHNFVFQNIDGQRIDNEYLPAICILKNILQRGRPTLMSKWLQETLGSTHQEEDFEQPYPLIVPLEDYCP